MVREGRLLRVEERGGSATPEVAPAAKRPSAGLVRAPYNIRLS